MLNLHVRTIRRYIREGRLAATRIGKQYRISGPDLAAFTGTAGTPADEPLRRRRVIATTTIDIDAIDPDESSRLTSVLTAVCQSSQEEYGKRVQTLYYEESGRLRIVISAGPSFTSSLLSLVDSFLDREGHDAG